MVSIEMGTKTKKWHMSVGFFVLATNFSEIISISFQIFFFSFL